MSAWDLIDLQNKYIIAIKRIKELEEEIRRLKMPKYSDTYDIPEDDWK